jgi:hypothetical protein
MMVTNNIRCILVLMKYKERKLYVDLMKYKERKLYVDWDLFLPVTATRQKIRRSE